MSIFVHSKRERSIPLAWIQEKRSKERKHYVTTDVSIRPINGGISPRLPNGLYGELDGGLDTGSPGVSQGEVQEVFIVLHHIEDPETIPTGTSTVVGVYADWFGANTRLCEFAEEWQQLMEHPGRPSEALDDPQEQDWEPDVPDDYHEAVQAIEIRMLDQQEEPCDVEYVPRELVWIIRQRGLSAEPAVVRDRRNGV